MRMIILAITIATATSTLAVAVRAAERSCGCDERHGNVVTRVHVHYVPMKKSHWCGEHPPIAPIFDSVAIRRVQGPDQQTRVRADFRLESGDLEPKPESGEKTCNGGLESLQKQIEELIRLMEEQQKQIRELRPQVPQPATAT